MQGHKFMKKLGTNLTLEIGKNEMTTLLCQTCFCQKTIASVLYAVGSCNG